MSTSGVSPLRQRDEATRTFKVTNCDVEFARSASDVPSPRRASPARYRRRWASHGSALKEKPLEVVHVLERLERRAIEPAPEVNGLPSLVVEDKSTRRFGSPSAWRSWP